LLGEPFDSKEVAIGVENFVIRGKAFFRRDLPTGPVSGASGRSRCPRKMWLDAGNTAEKSLPDGRYSHKV
jgi:hypothetical protein